MKQLREERRSAGSAVLALVAAAGLAGAASAQPARNPGDGRALDGGLSATGDRYNTRTRDINAMIRFNEAVISGNAPGGKSFRGGTSLSSTSEFRGTLGGSGIYSFQRDSALSGAAARGIRSSSALDYLFRAQTGGINPTGLDAAINPRDPLAVGATGRSIRSATGIDSLSSRLPTIMGYSRDERGNDTFISASPLGGVRVNPLTNDAGLTGLERTVPGVVPPTDFLRQRELDARAKPDPRLDARVDKPDLQPPGGPIDPRLRPDGTPYAPILDDFRQRRGPDRPERPAETRPLLGPDGRPLPPGAGPDGRPLPPGIGPDGKPLNPDGSQPRPPIGAAPQGPGAVAPSGKPQWLEDLDALRDRLRTPNDDLMPRPVQPPPAIGPDGKPLPVPGARRPGQTGVKDLAAADVLKRMGPRIDTLASPDAASLDLYGRLMRRGQDLMAAGRYFDAEEAFAGALGAKRGDALARVGRMHAQLGAGLFLSAAATMRELFTDRPELVPVRYGKASMMTKEWASGQADRLTAEIRRPTGVMADDAGMLLAYLGVQYGEPLWLENGLQAMRTRFRPGGAATAELVELLSEVWPEVIRAAPTPPPAPPEAAPNPPGERRPGDVNK
ncbi:MAG: hypothetical protein JNJ48_01340 [Phycisphaerae bacterium]|nr:hypothetical protein [Phycisphaerae bacterium]